MFPVGSPFPIGSPPRRVLIALYALALDNGYTGYGTGPMAAAHWEFMQEKTQLSRQEIGFTLTGLHAHRLVTAHPKTADTGAHLGQAWISDNGIALVQTWSFPPDPVPITIASITPDTIASLRQLTDVSRSLGVPEMDVQALTTAIEALANASSESERLSKSADIATVVQASDGLTRTFLTVALPALGKLLG